MCIPLITDQRRVHKYSDQTIPRINSLSHPLFHMIGFCNHKMKGISWYPSPPNQKNPKKINRVEFWNHSFSTQHSPNLDPTLKLDTSQGHHFFLFVYMHNSSFCCCTTVMLYGGFYRLSYPFSWSLFYTDFYRWLSSKATLRCNGYIQDNHQSQLQAYHYKSDFHKIKEFVWPLTSDFCVMFQSS